MNKNLEQRRFAGIFALLVAVACFFVTGTGEARDFLTLTADDITPDKAQQIALERAGGGFVIKWALDDERGKKVYEVEIADKKTRHSMDVDASSGAISDYEKKTRSSASDIKPKRSAQQAQAIALEKSGGGIVVKWELDYEKGRKIHEVKIIQGNTLFEIDINDADGTVIKVEKEKHG